jgi:hypothetical protein
MNLKKPTKGTNGVRFIKAQILNWLGHVRMDKRKVEVEEIENHWARRL